MFVCDICSSFCFERAARFGKGDRRAQAIAEIEKHLAEHADKRGEAVTPEWISKTPAAMIPRYDLSKPDPDGKRYLQEYVIPSLPENEFATTGGATVELHDEVEIIHPYWEPDALFYRELTLKEQEEFKARTKDTAGRQHFIVVGIEGDAATLMSFGKTQSYFESYPDATYSTPDWGPDGLMQYDASKVRREALNHLRIIAKNHQKPGDFTVF
jgi:hypothetical protein